MTPETVGKAHHNAALLDPDNVEFLMGEIESLPIMDASVDLIISIGVLNLCPDKRKVLGEIFRVLKSSRRLQIADILLEPKLTPDEVALKGSWSDRIAGAV
jgi:arsenite methyltransferase